MNGMTIYRLDILGGIWWPYGAPGATTVEYTAEDDEDALEKVDTRTGDFSSVDGFRLARRGVCDRGFLGWFTVRDWETEELEDTWLDLMYGEDD